MEITKKGRQDCNNMVKWINLHYGVKSIEKVETQDYNSRRKLGSRKQRIFFICRHDWNLAGRVRKILQSHGR